MQLDGTVRRLQETDSVRILIVKPDNIGDFVLATGAIRLLIREVGAANVSLCVKTVLVPLARAQFPDITIIELPIAAKRKVVNLFLRNFWMCSPLILKLGFTRFDASVCFRSMRSYLETLVFLVPNARRFVSNENILLRSGRKVRIAVEAIVNRARKTELVAYPETAREIPLEIEAHRRVVERVLGRAVSVGEVIPELTLPDDGAPQPDNYWVCAPLTSSVKKNYPPARWASVFTSVASPDQPSRLLLTGSMDQRSTLEAFRQSLIDSGVQMPIELVLPVDLLDFLKLIGGAGLVLTGDTAAAHFATATDRRALVLFSGMHTGMFGPWHRSDRQRWLLPTDTSEKPKSKWYDRIAPSRAAATIAELLADRRA